MANEDDRDNPSAAVPAPTARLTVRGADTFPTKLVPGASAVLAQKLHVLAGAGPLSTLDGKSIADVDWRGRQMWESSEEQAPHADLFPVGVRSNISTPELYCMVISVSLLMLCAKFSALVPMLLIGAFITGSVALIGTSRREVLVSRWKRHASWVYAHVAPINKLMTVSVSGTGHYTHTTVHLFDKNSDGKTAGQKLTPVIIPYRVFKDKPISVLVKVHADVRTGGDAVIIDYQGYRLWCRPKPTFSQLLAKAADAIAREDLVTADDLFGEIRRVAELSQNSELIDIANAALADYHAAGVADAAP